MNAADQGVLHGLDIWQTTHPMKNAALVLGLLIISLVPLFPQQAGSGTMDELDAGYQKFRDFFEHSIRQSVTDTVPGEKRFEHTRPERLPAWFFQERKTAQDSLIVLAVSDPGMDAETGLRLAKKRALIMGALRGYVEVSNIREHYTQEADKLYQAIYNDFSTFESFLSVPLSKLEVLESHVTQYEETMILARISKSGDKQAGAGEAYWHFSSDLYTRITTSENRIQVDEQLHLRLKCSQAEAVNRHDYFFRSVNQIVNTQSLLDGESVSELPALNLRYSPPGEAEANKDINSLQGYSLRSGLWHAIITSMLGTLNDQAHEGSIQLRQVGDVHNRLRAFLSNELVISTVRLSAPVFHVDQNRLYLDSPVNTDWQ